ncbi:hypothetical protein [Microbacterium timonense]|uniref:hypothetical protein n=1 Tax=Microbacterium timonense TaxID=2086576 RepID=UPI000D1054D3|nr:hypothetical protein [Microbacterium timonense]
MLHSHATASPQIGPVRTDWTIQHFLDWIASDDARAHDESLRPVLSSLASALEPGAPTSLIPRSTVAIVRAVGSAVRANPTLRDLSLGAVPGVDAAIEASASRGDLRNSGRFAAQSPQIRRSPRIGGGQPSVVPS